MLRSREFEVINLQGQGPFHLDPSGLVKEEESHRTGLSGTESSHSRTRIIGILCVDNRTQPRFGRFMEPPSAAEQLPSRQFLHLVTGHGVENVKEGFVGETGDFGGGGGEGGDVVAGGDYRVEGGGTTGRVTGNREGR